MSAFPVEADQATAIALLAPGLFGWCLNLMLFGMIIREVFDYTTSSLYREDKRSMKALMWAVFLLNTIQIGFNVAQLFNFVTNQKRDAASMLGATIIDNIAPLPVGLLAALVQTYLLTRAAKLFRSPVAHYVYSAAIGLVILLGFVGALWTTVAGVEYFTSSTETVGGISYNTALAMWQWSSAFVDVAITLTLALLLRNHIAGFNNKTDTVLRNLITLGLKTGSYTSIMAVCGAITATAFPGLSDMTTDIPEAFWVPLSGLYTLSLLATLSSRTALRSNLAPGGGGGGEFHRKTVQVDVEIAVAEDVRGGHSGSRDDDEFGVPARGPRKGNFIPMGAMKGARGAAMGIPNGFDEGGPRHVISFAGDEKTKEAMA